MPIYTPDFLQRPVAIHFPSEASWFGVTVFAACGRTVVLSNPGLDAICTTHLIAPGSTADLTTGSSPNGSQPVSAPSSAGSFPFNVGGKRPGGLDSGGTQIAGQMVCSRIWRLGVFPFNKPFSIKVEMHPVNQTDPDPPHDPVKTGATATGWITKKAPGDARAAPKAGSSLTFKSGDNVTAFQDIPNGDHAFDGGSLVEVSGPVSTSTQTTTFRFNPSTKTVTIV